MAKCNFSDCKKKAAMLIGDCKYCSSKYCACHRLPEDHQCSGMENCRQAHFDKNQTTLMEGKVKPNKGLEVN